MLLCVRALFDASWIHFPEVSLCPHPGLYNMSFWFFISSGIFFVSFPCNLKARSKWAKIYKISSLFEVSLKNQSKLNRENAFHNAVTKF